MRPLSGARDATRPLNPTGEPNVLLDVVTQLLPKSYLKRKWTIEGIENSPPARLTGILNAGSAVAMFDVLRTRRMLHRPVRRWVTRGCALRAGAADETGYRRPSC
jgi:hypothetical protein